MFIAGFDIVILSYRGWGKPMWIKSIFHGFYLYGFIELLNILKTYKKHSHSHECNFSPTVAIQMSTLYNLDRIYVFVSECSILVPKLNK